MSVTGFNISGDRQLIEKLKGLKKERLRRARAFLFNRGLDIINDAKDNYVPVDEGALRDTGKVTPFFFSNQYMSSMAVGLSFGDETTPQAVAIHEHPSESSPPSWEGVDVQFKPTGRGPKYLQTPLFKSLGTFLRNLADEIAE